MKCFPFNYQIHLNMFLSVTSGDPLSNMVVEFKSPEDAMDFCEKNGKSILSTAIPGFMSSQNPGYNDQWTYYAFTL